MTDTSGAVVAGAGITITNQETSVPSQVSTTDTGYYSVPNLIPGTYSVVAEAKGFKLVRVQNVTVNLNSIVRVDCVLEVGNISETVTVSAETALLKTEKADVSGVIEGRTLNQLPVLNRNVSQMVALLPGAVRGGAAFIGENPSSDTNGFVNGLGGGNNYHQLDGIDNQETIQGVAMVNPAIDSLQEMKITTNSYDAEFGQVAGAIFQASTKSGTNNFHGSAFEYLQNDKFFARNPWTQSTSDVAPWSWNQFGGSVGGPIIKDKLFFFGDYQGLRSRNGSTIVMGLPSPDMKRGDFSAVSSIYPIFDPLTGDADGRGRTQFAEQRHPDKPAGSRNSEVSRDAARSEHTRSNVVLEKLHQVRFVRFRYGCDRRTCRLQHQREYATVRPVHLLDDPSIMRLRSSVLFSAAPVSDLRRKLGGHGPRIFPSPLLVSCGRICSAKCGSVSPDFAAILLKRT